MECEGSNAVFSTTLLDLPVEDILVTHIAKYLNWWDLFAFRRCSRSCKGIAERMLAAGLWDLKIYQWAHPKAPYRIIFENCTRLRRISFSTLYWLTDERFRVLLSNNPFLEDVCLIVCVVLRSKGFLALAEHSANLRRLTLSHCYFNDDFLRALNENNNQLLKVDFSYSQRFSRGGLQEFFKKQPHLEDINLRGVRCNIRSSLSVIMRNCPNLHTLDIKGCRGVHEDDVLELAKKCPKLHTINRSCRLSEETLKSLKSKGIATDFVCSGSSDGSTDEDS
ncbi:F-box/LRR-repeat protein 15-like isoform X1 [Lutzomyia longipalpis]|uniref:F-box/LRR-repeat protein 15-like isoform X1 n=2 Tax=Lutzomyia longipalpis TaxID=7200 RepID=UPI002483400A|nr:F-box/LRR-repeat protein 15-like isoform X1 [Lutzomyia longipalpis]